MALIRAIASRDEQKASRLLDASPGLAQQVAEARLESQQARSENKLRNYLPGT